MDIVDFALSLFQGLLNDLIFLEIINLLLYFPSFAAEQRLAEHEEEGGRRNGLSLALDVDQFSPVQKLWHDGAQRIVGVLLEGENALFEGIQFHADTWWVDETQGMVNYLRFLL